MKRSRWENIEVRPGVSLRLGLGMIRESRIASLFASSQRLAKFGLMNNELRFVVRCSEVVGNKPSCALKS
jgi:hypothetical protein